LQQGHSDFLVRDFSAPESQCDLALIAFSQKPFDVAQLDVVVPIIGTGPELDLFDFNDLLLGLGFSGLLLLLVLELAVIHQATDRGYRGRGNFDQVNIKVSRHAQGLHQTHNPQGLVVGSTQADFGCHDFPVQPVLALFAMAAISEFSSDGSCPLLKNRLSNDKRHTTAKCNAPSRYFKEISV
jgi:hypothetical protein